MRHYFAAFLVPIVLLNGCATAPPRQTSNICAIFEQYPDWYDDAIDSQEEWGIPVPVLMAMMKQESDFQSNIRPPRTQLLGFIPWTRPSSAFGYAQAKDETWLQYEKATGQINADRDEFADAIDFMGWYNRISHTRLGIALTDAQNLYLAYHEGHGGFQRKTYKKKPQLMQIAKRVKTLAGTYSKQLEGCERKFKKKWWTLWLF
jgi:hypothetical protein